MFGSKKPHNYRRWWAGFAKGYEHGARDTSAELREKIIRNLVSDAVLRTNADVMLLERVVEIVEES